jgi:hypothetical protein
VDGKPYQPTYVSRIWSSLAGLNKNPALKEFLEKRQPSKELAAKVCHAGVATLTGRIRGHVRYSQARNTPFQGLAADGAALALFDLVKEGFRMVGFVHDEVLVELPDEGGYVSEARVRRVEEIMRRRMEEVLLGGIPVGCESALSRRWNKKAKLIVKDGRVYPWEPEAKAISSPVAGNPSEPLPSPGDGESSQVPLDRQVGTSEAAQGSDSGGQESSQPSALESPDSGETMTASQIIDAAVEVVDRMLLPGSYHYPFEICRMIPPELIERWAAQEVPPARPRCGDRPADRLLTEIVNRLEQVGRLRREDLGGTDAYKVLPEV